MTTATYPQIVRTPKGCEVTIYAPHTAADLAEIDAFNAEPIVEIDDEDPASDGYGWERAALRRIG